MKKRKANFKDIPPYYAYSRIKHKGYMYFLLKNLTTEQKQDLLYSFNNIEFYVRVLDYAPELKTTCILLYDKVIKNA